MFCKIYYPFTAFIINYKANTSLARRDAFSNVITYFRYIHLKTRLSKNAPIRRVFGHYKCIGLIEFNRHARRINISKFNA